MRLIKVKNGTYTKDGKTYDNIEYRLTLENGNYILIKPAFKDGYSKLNLLAEKE